MPSHGEKKIPSGPPREISRRAGAPTADLREKNFTKKSGVYFRLEKTPEKGVFWSGK
jgi:hypothetical protein